MKAVNIHTLNQLKRDGQKFPVITAYDSAFAHQIELAGIEVMLVGDSLGNVVLGYSSTVPVSMADMLHHTAAVARGNDKSLLIADMPFMSYATEEMTLVNSARLMQAGAHMVKLEGGAWLAESVASLAERGIPVCGHVGLTPQSVSALGGYKVQGKSAELAKRIIDDAKALEKAGAFAILFEMVPDRLCKIIMERAENCIIMSLGSGPHAHGQLLIYHDMFGLYPRFKPRMAKVFGNAGEVILNGLKAYHDEVIARTFPQPENWFGMKDDEFEELQTLLKQS